MADYRDDLLEVAPHGWGRMGVATVLSGCHEEEKLKQMVADLVSDDHDVRYEALGWMQQACVNRSQPACRVEKLVSASMNSRKKSA